MIEYLIVSTAVTDDVFQPNLDYVGSYLGGAGIYALSGISLWTPNVMLMTGVGSDFFKRNASWFEENNLSMDGLYEAAPLTPRTNIQYLSDGERIETSCFGAAHYAKMEPSAEMILRECDRKKGIYIFKEADTAFWNTVLEGKKQYGFAIEWEINANSAQNQFLPTVRSIAERCDIFSINLRESLSLLSVSTLEETIDTYLTWNVPMVFLRNGSNGSFVIRDNRVTFIPSISTVDIIDPTGAGNSSSAAVLYGYCEGFTDYDCGLLGNISASKIIAQYGPPTNIQLCRLDVQKLFTEQ